MKIADICTTDVTGRVTVTVEGRSILLPSGCRVKPMGRVMAFFAGSLTPGMTTPSAIYLSENLLPLLTVETVCHEATHWWQANKRMGAVSYLLTYWWHVLLELQRGQGSHWHDTHPMEVEARRCGRTMADLPNDGPINVEGWLMFFLPATR